MTWREIHDLYAYGRAPQAPNTYQENGNVAPTSSAPILVQEDGEWRVVLARWWFHPDWSRKFESNPKYSMFNARTDRLPTSKAYWPAFERGNRCLVPMDSFYEWVKRDEGGKQCVRIGLAEEKAFSLAGLFNRHKSIPDKDGFPVDYTFTLFTTDPCESFEPYHHRMPRPIPRSGYEEWMSRETSVDEALSILRPMNEEVDNLHWTFTDVDKPA